MIYFDQAASSFPKPPAVGEAMAYAVNEIGANPGRGGHSLARKAAELIQETRERAANIFGCDNPKHAIFFPNATAALNQAIKGLSWSEGDHIIATTFEHNSIRRPLEHLKEVFGVKVTYIGWNNSTDLFLKEVRKSITPTTKLIAMTHASNVTGTLIPTDEVAKIAIDHNILTLVDASQTAGHIYINMKESGYDMLVFPGHKGIMGPQGTGMLLLNGDIELQPILQGGTGNFSEIPNQPSQLPERLESGTLNTPGIAGLNAALKAYESSKRQNVPRETILIRKLVNGLKQIDGVVYYGDPEHINLPIAAFNILDIASQEVAMILDSHYKIAVRAGLHCSPLTHKAMDTTRQGMVRASLGIYNTEKEVDEFLQAIEEITESYRLV
ncbi:aminotransferase class V-fold PLP-dependent enzyme [Virgibacillus kekensis]|uniref:cysteine desulfurase n=1 Tax=Virgibacillus kekensis TaxID=202261 RepID=A0ABV9DIB8_9BACI